MPRAALSKRWYDEEDGTPPEKLINCFAMAYEDAEGKAAGFKITHVPGLGTATASIASACRGLWFDPNGIDARLIGIYGTDFYTFDSSFAGTDRANVASSTRLAKFASRGESTAALQVLSGTTCYSWNGTTLTTVNDADFPTCEDIAYLGGRFLALKQSSGRVYYSESSSSTSYTSTGYFEANADASYGVGLCVDNDDLFVFKQRCTEVWAVTTSTTSPYQRRIGSVIPRGCLSRDSIVRADNSIFFVGDDHAFYRMQGYTPIRVPRSRWLTTKIEALSNANQALIECQTLTYRDQTFVQISLPSAGSFWFNCATGEWNERATASVTEAACRVWTQNGDKSGTGKAYGVLCAGGRSADLYTPTGAKFTDGASAITRTFTAFIGADDAGNAIDNIAVFGTPGRISTGDTPSFSLSCSHNGGQSYETAVDRSFGLTGSYAEPVVWPGISGSVGPQGLNLKFTTAAAAAFDVLKVTYNEDLAIR